MHHAHWFPKIPQIRISMPFYTPNVPQKVSNKLHFGLTSNKNVTPHALTDLGQKSCWFDVTKVGQAIFFLNYFFKICVLHSKCLCLCTIVLNKTKKQQHNFISLSCAPFQGFIALICQSLTCIW